MDCVTFVLGFVAGVSSDCWDSDQVVQKPTPAVRQRMAIFPNSNSAVPTSKIEIAAPPRTPPDIKIGTQAVLNAAPKVCFLIFMSTFFIQNPSRLPIYMMADILQVARQLANRLKSFRRYRLIMANFETEF